MDNQNEPKKGKSYGISYGILVGIALGCWLNNLALWMCVGFAVGVGAAAMDAVKNKNDR